jgi:hypothetical protein
MNLFESAQYHPVWWRCNSATEHKPEHTIAHEALDGAESQESPHGYDVHSKSLQHGNISSQILSEAQSVELSLVVA